MGLHIFQARLIVGVFRLDTWSHLICHMLCRRMVLDLCYIDRCRTFGAFFDVEFDSVAFVQGSETT